MSDPYRRWQQLRKLVGDVHPSKSARDRDALTSKDDAKAYELKIASLRQKIADRDAKKMKMWLGFYSAASKPPKMSSEVGSSSSSTSDPSQSVPPTSSSTSEAKHSINDKDNPDIKAE